MALISIRKLSRTLHYDVANTGFRVTKLATSQKDTADGPGHAGIAIHDGTKFTPYNDPSRKENRWDLTMVSNLLHMTS